MNQSLSEGLWLHIGGQQRKAGWTVLNVMPGDAVDIVGDVTDLSRFADESCALIYCSHVLEHVSLARFGETLKGLARILKPGGRLFISVPDIDVLCHLMLSPRLSVDDKQKVMLLMFGGQSTPHDFHHVGLNFEFLTRTLQGLGFTSIEQVEDFGLFDDMSTGQFLGVPISLNVVVDK